jgi:molybdopterin-guanine dinucleotide biosynthesis protein A
MIFISVQNEVQTRHFHLPPSTDLMTPRLHFLYDTRPESPHVTDAKAEDISRINQMHATENDGFGVAAGLPSAYIHSPSPYWLVVACDYPLLTLPSLQQLQIDYQEPATCFVNPEGFLEPLLGVWSPIALQALQDNVRNGKTGPRRVMKELGGTVLWPLDGEVVRVLNTPEEWDRVKERLMDRER